MTLEQKQNCLGERGRLMGGGGGGKGRVQGMGENGLKVNTHT